jgi:hypothetical protein
MPANYCPHLARPDPARNCERLRSLPQDRRNPAAGENRPWRPAIREDRDHESWFTTISYWPDLESMTAFTKGEPTKVHHLDRDPELLIELPESIQIHRIVVDRQGLR